jgi:hypothetical protein
MTGHAFSHLMHSPTLLLRLFLTPKRRGWDGHAFSLLMHSPTLLLRLFLTLYTPKRGVAMPFHLLCTHLHYLLLIFPREGRTRLFISYALSYTHKRGGSHAFSRLMHSPTLLLRLIHTLYTPKGGAATPFYSLCTLLQLS